MVYFESNCTLSCSLKVLFQYNITTISQLFKKIWKKYEIKICVYLYARHFTSRCEILYETQLGSDTNGKNTFYVYKCGRALLLYWYRTFCTMYVLNIKLYSFRFDSFGSILQSYRTMINQRVHCWESQCGVEFDSENEIKCLAATGNVFLKTLSATPCTANRTQGWRIFCGLSAKFFPIKVLRIVHVPKKKKFSFVGAKMNLPIYYWVCAIFVAYS